MPAHEKQKQTGAYALIISSSKEINTCIENTVEALGVITLLTETEEQAIQYIHKYKISYVFFDIDVSSIHCENFIHHLRVTIGELYLPIILLASASDNDNKRISSCVSAGCDDVVFKPVTAIAINARISSLNQIAELQNLYTSSVNEQVVAKKILSEAIQEKCIHFKEIDFLSRSKAVFSGDLFLTARHPDGSLNILLADFTGHGLSAAIGALPVADVFSVMTEKGFELTSIIESINSKLMSLLPTSMFMACSVLRISNDVKHVDIWNGGMPDIYIRTPGNGNIRHQIKSSHYPLGISDVAANNYTIKSYNICSADQLILFTDGLTEALDANNEMFGEHRLETSLEKCTEGESIFLEIVNTFNKFCGEVKPSDDVTLVCIPCTASLMHADSRKPPTYKKIKYDSNWCWYMEFGGWSLREINPIPIIIDEILRLSGDSVSAEKLSEILSSLYENVINTIACQCKENKNNNGKHLSSNSNLNEYIAFIRVGIKRIEHKGIPALLVQMEDSGNVLSIDELIYCFPIENENIKSIDENPLVFKFNELVLNNNIGNRLEAIIYSQQYKGI